MKFISGYVWQGENREQKVCSNSLIYPLPVTAEGSKYELRNHDAVLLQQVRYGSCPILFACICSGNPAGGYITGQLIQWLYTRGMHFVRKALSDEKIEKEIMEAWKQVDREVEQFSDKAGISRDIHMTAVLIIGRRFWLIWMGNAMGYLLNCRFHRPHMRQLTEEFLKEGQLKRVPEIASGSLQSGVGILLCGGGFSESLPVDIIRDCLAVQDIGTQQQISRRLKELQEEGCKRSGEPAGSAVYVKIQ